MMKLKYVVIVCWILFQWNMVSAQKPTALFAAYDEIEKLWAEAGRLARSGDSVKAVREIERVERLSKEKFTSLRETDEWMSIKAKIYAFDLHNLDSAYDIQLRSAERLLHSNDHWALSTSARNANVYAFLRGWYTFAYVHALTAHVEEVLDCKGSDRKATLSCEYLVRSCLALRNYKEAYSYATWMTHAAYQHFQKTKDSNKYYAFFPLATSMGYQMESQINLGYYNDAEKIMNRADSLADAINRIPDPNKFQLNKSKYMLFPRIHLLTIQKKYDEALRYAQTYQLGEGLSLLDRIDLFYDMQYYLLLADIYHGQGKKEDEKKALVNAAYSLWKVNDDHPYMIDIFIRYARLTQSENQVQAINMLGHANKILKHCYLENSSYQSDILQTVLKIGWKEDVLRKFWPRWVLKVTQQRFSQLRKEFAECTFNERIHIWNHGMYKDWFENTLPQMVCEDEEMMANDTIIGCAFAGVQVAKSLLFDSEYRTRQLLESTKDKRLLDKYIRMVGLKRQLLRQGNEPNNNYGDLKKEIYQLDDDLRHSLHLYDDLVFNNHIALSYRFVRQIKDGDLYIDFVRYRSLEGKVKYGALMVMNGMNGKGVAPGYLFDEQELRAIPSDELYSTSKLYDLIWKRFEQPFKELGFKRIYFSATGDLHNLAIENVPDAHGKSISDKIEVARVMSVKKAILAQKDGKRKKLKKVSLWGNMDFQQYTTTSIFSNLSESLPYSRLELKAIRHLLPKGVQCVSYEGNRANEEAFKLQLSKGVDILHLATHGFYWDKRFRNQFKWFTSRWSEIFNPRTSGSLSVEDESMMNSVLLLSKVPGASQEDGILTASEIAMMDFSSVDLVVLSACQTGLGDMSSEGTLGLQRAFKKAGAKSMLISLKSVHDESTYLLMTYFYQELFAGKTKHEALLLAQHKLQTIHGGMYAHPKYWAPFILVDAFD